MNREEKKTLVAELGNELRASPATFFADYRGITCRQLTEVRRKLKASGGSVSVVKNSLMKLALKDQNGLVEKLAPYLKGPTLVIWTKDDPVSPAKVITDFAKTNEKFALKVGVVDGTVVGAADIQALAKLPAKHELQAKLLFLINAVATQVVSVINAPAAKLVRTLDAWRVELEKKD